MPPNVATSFGPGPVYAAIRHGSLIRPHILVSDIPDGSGLGATYIRREPSVKASPQRQERAFRDCVLASPAGLATADCHQIVIGGTNAGTSAPQGFDFAHSPLGRAASADRLGLAGGVGAAAYDDSEDRARNAGPSAHAASASLTDQSLAVLLLNLIAVAAWALVAFPMLREIAIGSVTALPWWLWGAFAVLMGGIAGGQVR